MENLKSHFMVTKGQQSGFFLLVLLIVGLLCVYFFFDFSYDDFEYDNQEITNFQKEIDSLKLVEIENRKPKINA